MLHDGYRKEFKNKSDDSDSSDSERLNSPSDLTPQAQSSERNMPGTIVINDQMNSKFQFSEFTMIL